jgi:MFS family permease
MIDHYAALRLPGVAQFIFGRMIAAFGRQMVSVAIGWQLYDRTHSPMALAYVGLAQIIPVVLLSLPAGVAADRFDRRAVALVSHLVLAACAGTLALLTFVDAPVWATYCVLAVQGGAVAFSAPAASSLLPNLVPAELYVNANAWRSSTFQMAALGGPAAAGFALDAFGALGVYLAGAGASLVYALLLLGVPKPPRAPARPTSDGGVRAGLRFVFRTRLLLGAITLDLFAVLLGGATALLPIFAKDILQVGPRGLGWLRAAPAFGAFTLALIQTRLPPWRRAGVALFVAVAGFGLATIGFGLSKSFGLSLVCLSLTGAFDNVSVVIRATLEQVVTPDELRGRVSAVHYVFIGLSNELGEFESGLAAALLGPVGAVVFGGVGTLVVCAVAAGLWPQLPRLRELKDLSPRA